MAQVTEIITDSSPPPGHALEQDLRQSPYWSLRQLICRVERDRVIVRGTVPSFYLKQVAQTLALKSFGLGCVENDIDVDEP